MRYPLARYERLCIIAGSAIMAVGLILSFISGKGFVDLVSNFDFRVIIVGVGIGLLATVPAGRWNRIYLPDDKNDPAV